MESLPREKLSSSIDNTMGQKVRKLLKVWEEGWEEHKKRLLHDEDYTALSNLKAIKEKIESWASQEAPPTEQEVLRDFKEFLPTWHHVDSVLLTPEELMNAGMRQQSLHILNGLSVDLTDDSSRTASTSRA